MTWDVLVQQWWLQVTAGVAIALIVAALFALVNKWFREKIWRPMGRALRWPFTLRVTTARQRAKLDGELKRLELDSRRFKEVCEILDAYPVHEDSTLVPERIAALRDAKQTAWDEARAQIEATQALAQQQVNEQVRKGAEQAETARALGRTEGRAQAMAEVEAQRAAPRLRPVWSVVRLEDGALQLRNTQEGISASDVQDVALDAPLHDFVFHGSSQWPGFFPGELTFAGELVSTGKKFGANLGIRWRDTNGDHCRAKVLVPPEPRMPRQAVFF